MSSSFDHMAAIHHAFFHPRQVSFQEYRVLVPISEPAPPSLHDSIERCTKRMVQLDEQEQQLHTERRKMEQHLQHLLQQLDEEESTTTSTVDCVICLNSIRSVDAQFLPCAHGFCRACIARWMNECARSHRQPHCPSCQQTI